MPAGRLLLFPDARLRQPAAEVRIFGEEVGRLVAEVLETMTAARAIGLSAPHIGVPLRVVVVRAEPGDTHRAYVNPVLAWTSPERASHDEGSVSMPGIRATIERPARILVRHQDLEGRVQDESFQGFEAAIIQHEIDQLDGIFWIDRLSQLKRERLTRRYEKLRRSKST